MTASPADVGRLLAATAKARAAMTDMPWAEPPPQPDWFDQRDAAEAEEFDVLMNQRNETTE